MSKIFSASEIEKTLKGGTGITNTIELPESTANGVESESGTAAEKSGNWLNSIEGILESGERLASRFFDKDKGPSGPGMPPPPPSKNNTGLYIGLGVGALVLIGAVILIARKK